jgi:DNA repair exonuclease SbcCD nuclease subunit
MTASDSVGGVRLAVIADPHVSVERFGPASWHNEYRLADSLDRFTATIAHPLCAGADALAVLGDLAHYGDERSLRAVVDAVRSHDVPVLLISGNHDVLEADVRVTPFVDEASGGSVTSPLARSSIAPLTAIAAGAGLDLVVHEVTAETARRTQPFDVEVVAALASDGDERSTLLLSHFPIGSLEREAREAGLLYSGHLQQLAALDVVPRSPTIALSGHQHLRGVAIEGPLLQIVFGALIEAPYEVAIVDVQRGTDGFVNVEYQCASVRDVDTTHVPVLAPDRGAYTWDGASWVAAVPATN